MNFLGIEINLKNKSSLEENFIPFGSFIDAYLKAADKPVAVVVRRSSDEVSVHDTFISGNTEADNFYIERLVKLLLWLKGGATVEIYGDDSVAEHIKNVYCKGGKRQFDSDFMAGIYEREFSVKSFPLSQKPESKENSFPMGGFFDGCRIGFDAGGSDRKVSAVVNGESIYSEEIVWFPKEKSDPKYHFDGIVEAFKTAASKMPRVDAIGVSSAGVYVNNRTLAASLFLKVPKNDFEKDVKDIYIKAAKEIGDVPLAVANDGDVSALAGALDLEDNDVLGIAMGTSQAGGYIDKNGNITGWLNELAFIPVDVQSGAMKDEWSGDIGTGCKYFSQDAVIKLAKFANIELDENLSLADKLKAVQVLMENGDKRASEIFENIGIYLGHSVNLYAKFYELKHILLLGRVMSGEGGNIILNSANRVLKEEYPHLSETISITLPDEKNRRVGQSVAAASLPKINPGII